MAPNNTTTAPASTSSASSTDRVRRPHHKSRTGCRSCKAKRIKCDEGRPKCGNCTRRNSECHYFHTVCTSVAIRNVRVKIPPLRRDSPDRSSVSDSSSHDSPTPSPPSAALSISAPPALIPGSIGVPAHRLIELRLFHHYQTMSARSLANQKTWTMWIASEAITTPSVMNALLGFSAFHMRRINDNDVAIRQASHKYMDLAIRAHAEQVAVGLTESNASSLIACCALILFHTSVNEPYISSDAGHKLPLHWFRPFKRAEMFFHLAWPCIEGTSTGQALRQFLVAPRVPPRLDQDSGIFDFLLEGLEDDGTLEEDVMSAYRDSVGHLVSTYYNPGYPKLLRFPTLVSLRFVDLLSAQDPRALAIAGYFFMMVQTSRLLWWVDGAAEREFAAIMAHLPRSWWPKMNMAMQAFNWTTNDHSLPSCQII